MGVASSAPVAHMIPHSQPAMLCRLHIQSLAEQLSELHEISHQQQLQVAATAQTATQQRDDAAWVNHMTSEIQALSSRITSLLRELVVSPALPADVTAHHQCHIHPT